MNYETNYIVKKYQIDNPQVNLNRKTYLENKQTSLKERILSHIRKNKIFQELKHFPLQEVAYKNYLILKKPNFQTHRISLNWGGYRVVFSGISLWSGLYLVDTPLENYKAYIPESVLQIADEMKQKGLTQLRVWAIVPYYEVERITLVEIRPDPLLVAEIPSTNHVAVGAIWGEDIENLDIYFTKQETEK